MKQCVRIMIIMMMLAPCAQVYGSHEEIQFAHEINNSLKHGMLRQNRCYSAYECKINLKQRAPQLLKAAAGLFLIAMVLCLATGAE